jgi:peptidyl-prolyl cis-trans isomerase C
MMRFELPLAAALLLAALPGAAASAIARETPIIVDGPIAVDAQDIEAFLQRVPEMHRADVRSSSERLATIADNLFIARTLATKARGEGLDKDPDVQRRMVQIQEALLAEIYLQKMEEAVTAINLEARARELYQVEAAKSAAEEHVHVQYLMIGLVGRTREMAAELARKLQEEAKSGQQDFLALAARHSEDPDKSRNGGELGYRPLNAFPEAVAKRIAEMSRKGEISAPIETTTGFHVVRFMGRKKVEPPTFEAMKESIIAAEKQRLFKERHEALVRQIRSSSTVTVYRKNLDALVVPMGGTPKKSAPAKP